MMTGRRWTLAVAYVVGFGIPGSIMLLGEFGGDIGHTVAEVLKLLSGSTIVITTIVCFFRITRSRLVAPQTTILCAFVVLAIGTMVFVRLPGDWVWRSLGTCLTLLAVLPFASLPLALRWNRHR